MSKGSETSKFLAKHKAKVQAAHAKHKKDEVAVPNTGDLPTGMEGVAKLVDLKVQAIAAGKQNAGEYVFLASAVVISPEYFTKTDGAKVKTQGRRTSVIVPLFDTKDAKGNVKKTLDDNYATMLNHLRLLGADTTEFDPDSLDAVFAALKKSAPKFNFRTWGGPSKDYPNGRVNHEWGEQYDGDDIETDGEGGEVEEDEAEAQDEAEADAETEEVAEDEAEETEEEAEETEEVEEEEEAEEEEAVEEKPKGKKGAAPTQTKKPTAKEPTGPEVGEILYFAPLDPATKKPGKKKVEVEVKKVHAKDKKADVVLVDDPKKGWNGIAWDRLSDQAK